MRRIHVFAILALFLLILSHSAVRSAKLDTRRSVVNRSSTISVTSPEVGDSVKAGSKLTVAWKFSGTVGSSAKIYLHKNSAPLADKLLATVILNITGTGACSVLIPLDSAPGSDYTIVIVSTQYSFIKSVSDQFSVVDSGLPTIISFSPTTGATDDVVSIIGKNFSGAKYTPGGGVYIGNTNGIQVDIVSDTLIQAKVAWTATDGPVVVKNSIGSAQRNGFTKLYSIGDYIQGGMVVHTGSTRRHGLIAAREDSCVGCEDPHGCCYTCTWADANAKCQQPQNGTSGWRLPSRLELIKVFIAYESGKSHLSMHAGYACLLWSSTPGPTDDTAHVLLNPYTDIVYPKTNRASARAVKTF